jgi:transposase
MPNGLVEPQISPVIGAWSLHIVKRFDAAGFEVLPKRWIIEQTFAWIGRNRRLARNFDRYATTTAATRRKCEHNDS